LLGGLVAVNLLPQAEKAKRTAARTQMKALESAVSLYKLDVGRYPTTDEGLEALVDPPNDADPYMQKIPKDPWDHPYVYLSPSPDGKPYEIRSYGADGQPGGDGDNADISNWDDGDDKK